MGYFLVKNWRKYQHYQSNRKNTWVKLYADLLTSEDWVTSSDASRVLMVASILLALRHDGKVPANPEYVRRVCYLNEDPDFKPLVDSGFLQDPDGLLAGCYQDASKLLAQSKSVLDKEEEEERDLSSSSSSSLKRSEQERGGPGGETRFVAEGPKPKPTAEERMVPWRQWREKLVADFERVGVSRPQVDHIVDEVHSCLAEHYELRGGRLTPTRLGRVGAAFLKWESDVGLFAAEVFADKAGSKHDERYLIGIGRRLFRLSSEEFTDEMKSHRLRFPQGIWAGRPK